MTLFTAQNFTHMSQTRLPPEVWLNIVRYSSRHDVLYNLSYVSSEFNRYANTLLYCSIEWEWQEVPFHCILRLLENLVTYPELGRYICYLRIERTDPFLNYDWEPPRRERYWRYRVPSEHGELYQRLRNHIFDLNLPDTTRWVEEVRHGNPYVFVALTLSFCSNLRYLSLDYSFVQMGGWPGRLITAAYNATPAAHPRLPRTSRRRSSSLRRGRQMAGSGVRGIPRFEMLEKVFYGHNVPDTWHRGNSGPLYPQVHPHQFQGLFYLPAVWSLGVWLRHPPTFAESPHRVLNIGRIRDLCIVRATIQETDIEQILRRATSVVWLHLGLSYHPVTGRPFQTPGNPVLNGLLAVRDTVALLSVGVEYEIIGFRHALTDQDRRNWAQFYGFLHQFRRLVDVELPIQMLLGVNGHPTADRPTLGSVLPPTVSELVIRWDNWRAWPGWTRGQILGAIQQHLLNTLYLTPELEIVTVRMWRGLPVFPRDTQLLREQMLGATGVEVAEYTDAMTRGLMPTRPGPLAW
ncbi:uncharacterized protein BP01DRAFT_387038 [Aspergillus saccharolyticus JOP 1030-1]|uniref:F-box domain-containing protein n=1 Tax=Aspergillus saccharolyticus JOP 1030-1 TaxID=1450539 RepID=A0A318Z7U2_9EURO|nr:hypothetical protein BP01DRAFT_387038 [Aspergillus saccharolyticus JOP 1030-1]PYH40833.1 hypothetical protein BP01DRAFT_387038 [Aspergillus saccharolyticus JOP 1030-1]